MFINTLGCDIDRYQLLEFPYVVGDQMLKILYRPFNYYHFEVSDILRVFPSSIWFLILASFILTTMINSVKYPRNKLNMVFEYFGLLLAQGISGVSGQNRVVLSSWLISAL